MPPGRKQTPGPWPELLETVKAYVEVTDLCALTLTGVHVKNDLLKAIAKAEGR